jgi:hypothetical protein
MDDNKNISSRTIKNILSARKHEGLYNCIVTGKRGIGKSSYCMQVLYNIFRALGYDIDTSWEMSLDRIIFKVKDVVDFLEKSVDQKDKDIFIWDDAGVYAGGVRWLTDQREMVLIESICDTFRDCVYGVLFTVPDQRTLSRRIRSYDDFLVKIYYPTHDDYKQYDEDMDTSNIRVARLYKKVILPSSQVRIYRQYYDTFDVMLPFWVYDKYKEKRHRYTKDNIQKLKDNLKNNDNIDIIT